MTDTPRRWKKSVNGEEVDMTQEEIDARLAEEAMADEAAPAEAIRQQIRELELTITDRRLREAVLGTDGEWLANVNAEIAALRAQL